jgi:adenosylhomocysteine nucleosidase
MAVIAVTGLRAEAAIARRAGFTVVCAGGVPERTRIALDRALDGGGADAIVSIGIAGGIAPRLQPGELIVASEVIDADGEILPVDAAWAATVRRMIGAHDGAVLGALVPAGSAAAKAALFGRTGALAVDLESLAVARAAQNHRLPCLVMRAIADPAGRDLPPAALIALRPDGTADLVRIISSIVQHPGQIVDLVRLARDAGHALRALRRAVTTAQSALLRSAL